MRSGNGTVIAALFQLMPMKTSYGDEKRFQDAAGAHAPRHIEREADDSATDVNFASPSALMMPGTHKSAQLRPEQKDFLVAAAVAAGKDV